ncbi:G5 domain-containing protein [Sanguibacter sp. A247]|uniref:aggregation-promoting factor C-terminal-like domain-containing protein n=1 Tax=unclassified Sanguibacter TaxID=2645534 RepID=UPI003FD7F4A8
MAAQVAVLAIVVGGTAAYVGSDRASDVEPTAVVAAASDLAVRTQDMASRGAARATLLTIVVDGVAREVTTTHPTVRTALHAENITLDDTHVVLADLDATVTDGMRIELVDVTESTATVTETVEHGSSEIDDPDLVKGTRIVETRGSDGESRTTYLVRSANGDEIERTPVTSVVVSEVRDEVVRVGTMSVPDASTKVLSPKEAKALAKSLVAERGWDGRQFSCLNTLWTRESNWRVTAHNTSSGAYGIPQSLPGTKMASVASDWRTNARTQIIWGLGYIENRYGTPCGALSHSHARGWY